MTSGQTVPTGPMRIPQNGGFPWRTVVVGLGVLLLPVLVWVMLALLPQAKSSTPTPQATIAKASGRNLLADVRASAVGVPQEEPTPATAAPAPQTNHAPVDTSQKDRVIDRLNSDVAALNKEVERLRAQLKSGNNGTPKGAKVDEAKAREAAERQREADEARKTLDVWTAKAEDLKAGIQSLKTPYSLPPTTLIHCVTEMEVTNQASGAFRALVTESVRTASGTVVIPPMSKLLMRQEGKSIFGDERIGVRVDTLTFPDDQYVSFKKATVGDQQGASGFKDQIDRRWPSLFASIVLTGVLRSGTGLITGGYGGDTASRVGGSIAGETANQGQQQVKQVLRTEPILTIRPHYPCEILLEEELVLTRAWADVP